jgi:energy-coupling factor transport system substrate-specific component
MAAPSVRAPASPIPTTLLVTLIPAAAALSIVASYIAVALGLPIYLDAIGTCVVAIVLGPWWGALTGVLTNVGGAFFFGPTNIPFALANVLAALLWGYGVRRLGLGRSAVAYFVLCVVVGVVTGAIGAVIALFVFGGSTGHPSDVVTGALLAAGAALVNAVFTSSILTSVADKVISGFLAVAIIGALPPRYTDGVVIPGDVGGRTLVVATGGVVAGIAILLVYLFVIAPAG